MPSALLVIDMQHDFMPGGSMAVKEGHLIIPIVNRLIDSFKENRQLVVTTQDWHPSKHGSFASTHGKEPYSLGTLFGMPQVMWPDHCIQNSEGAKIHEDLRNIEIVVRKGTDPSIDSYSGFFDNGQNLQTELHYVLQEHKIDTVYICGLATDYCVHFTATDAKKLGYATYVITDACGSIDSPPGEVARAKKIWKEKDIVEVSTREVLAKFRKDKYILEASAAKEALANA